MKITNKLIASIIIEAIEKEKEKKELPKSSGKLIDLKKNLKALNQLKDELSLAKFAQTTASTEIEFADLAKFVKEYNLIKAKGIALEQKIDNQIQTLKDKITAEQNKIKDLIGLKSSTSTKDDA